MNNINIESFDEDILYNSESYTFIIEQSIEEDEQAEDDIIYTNNEMTNIDSILDSIDATIDSIYADYK